MSKRLKRNISTILIYAVTSYVLILPLSIFSWKFFIANIGISLILGFCLGFINEILTELRKLNGEKFPHLDDMENGEMIKS